MGSASELLSYESQIFSNLNLTLPPNYRLKVLVIQRAFFPFYQVVLKTNISQTYFQFLPNMSKQLSNSVSYKKKRVTDIFLHVTYTLLFYKQRSLSTLVTALFSILPQFQSRCCLFLPIFSNILAK